MTTNQRVSTETGDGTLLRQPIASEPPPAKVSEGDMELLLTFQQDLAAAQKAYAMLMQQFAQRYQMQQGDVINMDCTITRRSDGSRP